MGEIGCERAFQLRPMSNVLKTVNGESMSVMGSVDLVIEMTGERFDIPFVICDIEADGILGQDFLTQNVDNINYRRSCLMIGHKSIPLWTGGQANQVCRVELQHTVRIPSHTRKPVTVRIPLREHLAHDGYIEPCIELMAKSEVCVMGGIVDTRSHTFTLNLLNYGPNEITVHKNTNLGSCESYYENEKCQDRIATVHETSENGQLPEHLLDLYERSSVHLSDLEKQGLHNLLFKYQSAFSKNPEDIGRTDMVQHTINTGTSQPIRQPPRRLPLGKRQVEKEEIDKMLKRGIIEPSNSAWSSPVVLITKKDGTPRFCIDYRKVNDATVKDAYPIPRVGDCIDALSGSKYFGSLDLNSGFWQVGMSPEDKEKTAFATTMGLYQFTVMSFGLANAPSTFERLMENVLRGLQWVECLLYMDDIIIPSKSVDEGFTRLERIFQRLQQANLKCKPSKCVLFQKQVKFLGHLVSEHGVATDPEKIASVKNWTVPRNAKEVKSFLGLCSYYRRFVQDFSKIARPLHKLAEKSTKYEWSKECSNAFETLKQALISAPILGYPVANISFILDTDASNLATGAVLSQIQNDRETVIAYNSKSFNQHEQNYCVTRKELLAVVHALKSFHHYLYGQPVLLRTDNAAVSWMKNLKQPTGQVARWLETLGTYNLTVKHRPGLQHRNADALSRAPCTRCSKQQNTSENVDAVISEDLDFPTPEPSSNLSLASNVRAVTRNQSSKFSLFKQSLFGIKNWSIQEIQQQQRSDQSLEPIITQLEKSSTRPTWQHVVSRSNTTKTLWRMWDRLVMIDKCLFRNWHNNDRNDHLQLIVPDEHRRLVMYHMHDIPSSGHLGTDKMLAKIQQSFYWPAMKRDVESYCSKCHQCAGRKPAKPHKSPMGSIPTLAAFERCAVDIFGPLPRSRSGNAFVLVICDCFTRYTEAIALPNQLSETIVKAFVNEYVSRFGVPMQIHSDRGSNFVSKLFEDMCKLLHMDHTRSTAMHPQSNGTVERFNRTLGVMLSMYCDSNQRTWDEHLPQVMMAYRSSQHVSTGQTPNKMIFGHNIVLPLQACIGLPPNPVIENKGGISTCEYVTNLQEQLEIIHESARKVLKNKTQYRKRHYDLHARKRAFKLGDLVWLHDTTRRPGVCNKLSPQWKGPFLVTKKIDDLVYLIKRSSSTPAKAIHIDRLTSYKCSNVPTWLSSARASIVGNMSL